LDNNAYIPLTYTPTLESAIAEIVQEREQNMSRAALIFHVKEEGKQWGSSKAMREHCFRRLGGTSFDSAIVPYGS
jgi:hypothetical protein